MTRTNFMTGLTSPLALCAARVSRGVWLSASPKYIKDFIELRAVESVSLLGRHDGILDDDLLDLLEVDAA